MSIKDLCLLFSPRENKEREGERERERERERVRNENSAIPHQSFFFILHSARHSMQQHQQHQSQQQQQQHQHHDDRDDSDDEADMEICVVDEPPPTQVPPPSRILPTIPCRPTDDVTHAQNGGKEKNDEDATKDRQGG